MRVVNFGLTYTGHISNDHFLNLIAQLYRSDYCALVYTHVTLRWDIEIQCTLISVLIYMKEFNIALNHNLDNIDNANMHKNCPNGESIYIVLYKFIINKKKLKLT
jgi:hypothetical protein